MISLSAKIEPVKGARIYISGDEGNNISVALDNFSNSKSVGNNAFLLGVSKFSDKATFVNDNVDYYIGNVISDSNGNFANPYSFVIDTTNTNTFIVLYFDTINNEYPPSVDFDGETYNLNAPVLCLQREGSSSHTLAISSWNKPNRPLVIHGLQTFVEINGTELLSVDFSGQDRSDPYLPSWGIKSNSGTLDMIDTYGVIEDMQRIGVLKNSEISIYLNANSRKHQIGGFYVGNSEKDRRTLKANVKFQDVLLTWDKQQMPEYSYPYYPRTIYLKDILNTIVESSPITLKYAEQMTEERLSSLYIPYPILDEGSLWAQMTKICEVSSCYIYCDNEGIPTIHYGGDT